MFSKRSLYLYVCCTSKSSQSRFCQQPFKAIFCSNCTIAVYDYAIQSGRKIKTLRAVGWPDEIQDKGAGFFIFREKTRAFLSTISASFISVRLTAPSNIKNLPRKRSQNFSFNLRVYLHSKQFARLSMNKNSTKLHCHPASDRTKKPRLR